MNIDKEELTIGAIVFGAITAVVTRSISVGSAYSKMIDRIKALEEKPVSVQEIHCIERRESCNRENRLRFNQGEKQFQEIKDLISENDKANNARHAETIGIMKVLLEMNRQ